MVWNYFSVGVIQVLEIIKNLRNKLNPETVNKLMKIEGGKPANFNFDQAVEHWTVQRNR